jgi:glycosyltransferase involved in cell wall biosynthesis
MGKISAIIITKNEEERIRECLESVTWVDEIVVVDSYSSDKTLDIAAEYTDKLYKRVFDNFASQKNYAIDQASFEWIINIDADERVTKELKNEIVSIIGSTNKEAFITPIKTYFLNKPMKYAGTYPIERVRLFKKNYRFHKKVHESIDIEKNKVGKLESSILHYTCLNLEHYIKKYIHYAKLSAKQKHEEGKKSTLIYAVSRLFLDFIQKYFLQRGFLMGGAGFVYSVIRAYYSFLKYLFLWELNKKDN